MAEDYCELCDLPLSTCVHGMPKRPPEPVAPPKATPVRRRSTAAPSGSTARVPGSSKPAAAPAKPRRRTHQDDFKPYIVRVLQEVGGEREAELVMLELEERMAEVLREGDREVGPTGEVRWRTAVRWARKELADDGFLVAPRPGVWQLTDRGAELPADALD